MKFVCKQFVCPYKTDESDRKECCCTCKDQGKCDIVCSLINDVMGVPNCRHAEFKKDEKSEGE